MTDNIKSDFLHEIIALGKEYKEVISNTSTRKERIALAMRYHSSYIQKAKDYNIRLPRENEFKSSFINCVSYMLKKYDKRIILDYGCDDGQLLRQLTKKAKNREYFGIDFDIYHAKNTEDITFLKYNEEYLIPNGYKFDFIISHDVVEHIDPRDTEAHLADIYEHLETNGIYFLNQPSKYCSLFWQNLAIDQFHLGLYSYEELEALLKKVGFSKVKRVLFNVDYVPSFINPLVDIDYGSSLLRFKNKFVYGFFNFLSLRIIAIK